RDIMDMMGAGQESSLDTFDFKRDEEELRMRSKSRSNVAVPSLTFSTSQLQELKRVSEERLTAEKLRKLGYKPKDSLGVRYEDT
ncbi:hypothetical protein HDU76_010104, partial [Blyttiomyces sp. JEL0837]